MQQYEYDTFGNMAIATDGNIRLPYAYTGREYDQETGMYFYQTRYYDPKVGRFVTKDPIGFSGGGVNLYGYVQGNPVNWIDPDGLATYRCKKPLNALNDVFGPKVSNFAYKYIPYANHQYSCIVDKNGIPTCGGQDRSGDWRSSPGKPSDDSFNKGDCMQTQPDNNCFESCMSGEWKKERPRFGIPFGTDCQKYDDGANLLCRIRCNIR